MANNYWENRIARAQEKITNKNIKEINKQMAKYYSATTKKVIDDFVKVYEKILAAVEDGKEPTPANLYKLDAYWKMQGQLRDELQRLGEKQIATLSKNFETHFFEVYYSIALDGGKAFTTIDTQAAQQMINAVWVADGKTYSDRVWGNISRLQETLNEELILTVTSGRKPTELKKALQERFGVSYHRANTLVRTELVHIQTQAAQQRYKDYGIKEVEVLVDVDNRTCEKCKALVGKRFPINGTPPLPVHPNERCALIPIIE